VSSPVVLQSSLRKLYIRKVCLIKVGVHLKCSQRNTVGIAKSTGQCQGFKTQGFKTHRISILLRVAVWETLKKFPAQSHQPTQEAGARSTSLIPPFSLVSKILHRPCSRTAKVQTESKTEAYLPRKFLKKSFVPSEKRKTFGKEGKKKANLHFFLNFPHRFSTLAFFILLLIKSTWLSWSSKGIQKI